MHFVLIVTRLKWEKFSVFIFYVFVIAAAASVVQFNLFILKKNYIMLNASTVENKPFEELPLIANSKIYPLRNDPHNNLFISKNFIERNHY